MPGIIAIVLIAIVGLIAASFAMHILFSPWLLLAIGIVLLIKFRPRRSHR
jgi:D-alanyl-lipoteichoic acid acyltransferase DltB (MBOAT superfamily)